MPNPVGTRASIPEPTPSEPPEDGGSVALAPSGKPALTSSTPSTPSTLPVAQPLGAQTLVERYRAGSSGDPVNVPSKPAAWYVEKAVAELDCRTFPPALALRAAEWGYMARGGLAQKMLDHFLSGSSAPVRVDLNAELERNPQLREYVASRIESEIAERTANGEAAVDIGGSVWVPQSAYGPSDAGKDQQLALGGTYFEFQVVGSSVGGDLEVSLNVADHYFWSPSDKSRSTQCLHVAGAKLVAAGVATEFYQVGVGRLTVADPSRTEAMDPIEGPPGGPR